MRPLAKFLRDFCHQLIISAITNDFATTRMVYCESPGSQTLEVQDIPAIAEVARARGILVAADNT